MRRVDPRKLAEETGDRRDPGGAEAMGVNDVVRLPGGRRQLARDADIAESEVGRDLHRYALSRLQIFRQRSDELGRTSHRMADSRAVEVSNEVDDVLTYSAGCRSYDV